MRVISSLSTLYYQHHQNQQQYLLLLLSTFLLLLLHQLPVTPVNTLLSPPNLKVAYILSPHHHQFTEISIQKALRFSVFFTFHHLHHHSKPFTQNLSNTLCLLLPLRFTLLSLSLFMISPLPSLPQIAFYYLIPSPLCTHHTHTHRHKIRHNQQTPPPPPKSTETLTTTTTSNTVYGCIIIVNFCPTAFTSPLSPLSPSPPYVCSLSLSLFLIKLILYYYRLLLLKL